MLRRLLASLPKGRRDPTVLVGPGIGLDAAAIRLGSHRLVLKTDPITFLAEDLGLYALTINANDLATMGARPRWFLATLLLPAGATSPAHVAQLFRQLGQACRRLDVTLCGGHTEITDAVTRPVIVGCLLGECAGHRLLTTTGARVDDALLLTKGIPIEAVSVLARVRKDDIRRACSAAFLARCRRFVDNPGVSVGRDARIALSAAGVHAMHDPTEGGLSAALYELAEAAGVGLRVMEDAVRIVPEGKRLCAQFGINPWGAIASGALLISVDETQVPALLRRFLRAKIPAARIGTVLPKRQGVRLVRTDGTVQPVPRFEVDELARLLGQWSVVRG